MPTRNEMLTALRRIVFPRLRELGFKGSSNNFRRCLPDRIDLFTFQFNSYGGSFVIELGQCDAGGYTTDWGEHITPDKLQPAYLDMDHRVRLLHAYLGTDQWFEYEDANGAEELDRIAQSVLPYLEIADRIFRDSLFPGNQALKTFRKERYIAAIKGVFHLK